LRSTTAHQKTRRKGCKGLRYVLVKDSVTTN
jgi:hypothetical protein